jgi:RHS repeat-associated protein
MQPDLVLAYNSSARNGIAGVGWTLSVESSIERCGKSQAIDGFVEPVRFDATDSFCLDGERLVLVAGDSGGQGAEYRTRHESFAKVVVEGTDALGPTAFIVYSRDGRIARYGAQPETRLEGTARSYRPVGSNRIAGIAEDSRAVRYAWLIEEVADRTGNAMRFRYESEPKPEISPGLEQVLAEITYTASTNPADTRTPLRSVRFWYQPRPDVRTEYVSGLRLSHGFRLGEIEVRGPGQHQEMLWTLKEYRLRYISGSSGRSLLTSLTECEDSTLMATCRGSTFFGYSRNEGEFEEIHTPVDDVMPTQSGRSGLPGRIQIVDLNGDGRDDIFYSSRAHPNQYAYRLAELDATGKPTFGDAQLAGLTIPARSERPQPLDVNVDGQSDLLAYDDSSQIIGPQGPVGAGYRLIVSQTPAVGPPVLQQILTIPQSQAGFVYGADVDGDRRPDLLLGAPDSVGNISATPTWTVARSAGGPLNPQASSAIVFQEAGLRLLDVDGDGASEVLVLGNPLVQFVPGVRPGTDTSANPVDPDEITQWYTALEFARGPNHDQPPSAHPTTLTATEQYVFADLNGDGLTDAIALGSVLKGFRVSTNSAAGFEPPRNQPPIVYPVVVSVTDPTGPAIRVMDFDGDERQDILVRMHTPQVVGDPVLLLRAQGEGLAQPQLLPFKNAWDRPEDSEVIEVLDVNGDGLDDVVLYNGGTLDLYVRKGPKPDQLISVTDGFGAKLEVSYAPTNAEPFYTPRAEPCEYPQRCLHGKRWVVDAYREDDGLGGRHEYQYSYEDGRVDTRSATLLGFSHIRRFETDNDEEILQDFDLEEHGGVGIYPFAGTPRSVRVGTPLNGSIEHVTRRDTSLDLRWSVLGKAYFVYPQFNIEKEMVRDTANSATLSERSTRRTVDDFGNLTLMHSTWSEGGSSTTAVQFENRTSEWLLGLPRVVTETRVTASGSSGRRRLAYNYDTAGQVQRITVEPGAPNSSGWDPLPPQADGVQTRYVTLERKADGQIEHIREDVSATPSPQARVSTLTYEPLEGITIASIENAMGQVIHFENDPSLELPTHVAGVDGVATIRHYDHFGRLHTEARVGTPALTVTYASSPTAGDAYMTIETLASGEETRTLYDRFERSRETRSLTRADGKEVCGQVRFDSFSRIQSLSDPYFCGETPRWTHFRYDNLSREVVRVGPDNATTRTDYADAHFTAGALAADLRQVKVTDPGGYHQSLKMNERGLTVASLEEDGSNTLTTGYQYHPFDEVALIDGPAAGKVVFKIDRLGSLLELDAPDATARKYSYNAFGELEREVSAVVTVQYVRDALGRVTQRIGPEGTQTTVWDSAPHGVGKLATVSSDSGIETQFDYNGAGLLQNEIWVVPRPSGPSEKFSLEHGYDSFGRPSVLRYPSVGSGTAFELRYVYGAHGQLTDIQDAASGLAYWTRLADDPSEQFGTERLGNQLTRERREDPQLPNHLRRLRITHPNGKPVEEIDYHTDVIGNVRTLDRLATSAHETFAYDSLDRLAHWTLNGATRDITYHYAKSTSLESQIAASPASGTTRTFATGGTLHAVTSNQVGSFGYDASGNRIAAPALGAIQYSSADLPVQINMGGQPRTYRYDGDGERIAEERAGERRVTLERLFDLEEHAGNVEVRDTLLLGDRALAQVAFSHDASGSWTKRVYYLHTDDIGSVIAVTDETGAVVDRFAYEPFGVPLNPSNLAAAPLPASSGVQLRFVGRPYDAALGLSHLGARLYDPANARFLSQDPILADMSHGLSFDPYAYAFNNPISNVDAEGLKFGTNYASKTVGSRRSSQSGAVEDVGGSNASATDDIPDSPVDEDALMASLEKRPQGDRSRASASIATGSNDAGLGERATPTRALDESNLTMNGAFGMPVAKIWYISLARNPFYGHPLVYRDRNKMLLVTTVSITGATIGIGALAAGGEWALAGLVRLLRIAGPSTVVRVAGPQALILRLALGRNAEGARQILQALKEGAYRIPPGLTTELLMRYREIALRTLADPNKATAAGQAVQALRLQIVEQLLLLLRAAGR